MSNALELVPNNLEVPAYLAQYQAQLMAENESALKGLSAGAPPSITLSGTRFVVKENGEETVLNQLELGMVVLKSKENMDKAFYLTKFTPGQEASAPDCYSRDGVLPDSSCSHPQAPSCAGCPQNQFETSTNPDGTLGKGKACADNRIIAVFANSGVYQFKIPPASLKNFASYVKQLSARGLFLSAVITKVSFDAKFTYPVLIFTCAGVLDAGQFTQLQAKKDSPEVLDIIGAKAVPALPAPVAQVAQAPVQAQVAQAPVTEKPKAAAAQTKRAATTPPQAPVQHVAQPTADLGLGLAPAAAVNATPVTIMGVTVEAPAQHSQVDIASSLGLVM